MWGRPSLAAPLGRAQGFTLIELVVVMLGVAVLGALAYPSYADVVRRAARVEAQAELMQLAQWLERRYLLAHRYAADDGAFVGADQLPVTQSPRTGRARYRISAVATDGGRGYVLEAVPVGSQVKDPCGTLRLDHRGAQAPAQGADGRDCW